MGVYIPNVRLPADGDFELWVAVKKDGSFTYNVSGEWRGGKQKAVPVPPHGDLIDRDKIAYFKDDSNLVDFDYAYRSQINSMPTIIPASEEGET